MEELKREFQNLTQSTMKELKELKELRGTCKTHAFLSQYFKNCCLLGSAERESIKFDSFKSNSTLPS